MAEGIDFSALHDMASLAVVAREMVEQAGGTGGDPSPFPMYEWTAADQQNLGRLRRVRDLTARGLTRTPEEDSELLDHLAALRDTASPESDIRQTLGAAHDALAALTGPATGRAPQDAHAAQIAGAAPPGAIPAIATAGPDTAVSTDSLEIVIPTRFEAVGDRTVLEMAIKNASIFLRRNREHFAARYPDKWVVVTRDGVIAVEASEAAAMARIRVLQAQYSPFSPFIDNPCQPPLTARMPSFRLTPDGVGDPDEGQEIETGGGLVEFEFHPPVDSNVVAVMGAGKMGSDIAYALLSAGFTVRIYDSDPKRTGAIEKSRTYIEGMIAKGVRNGKLSEAQAESIRGKLTFFQPDTPLGEVVRGAGYVMEAVFESYAVKIPLFEQLNAVAHPETIFLTNTSTLSVTKLAKASGRPDRFAGAHFFWPAYSNPLLEITGSKGYSVVELEEARKKVAELGRMSPRHGPWRAGEETIARAHAFGRRLGKVVLTTVDTPGFIANRFFVPWAVEGAYLLDKLLAEYRQAHPDLTADEATAVAQEFMILIDDATKKAFGVGLGPFRIMNETGPQIHFDSALSLGQLGEHYKPAPALTHLLAWTPQGEKPLWQLPTSTENDKRRAAKDIAAKEAALLSSLTARLGHDRFNDLHRFIGDRILGLTFRIVGDLYREGYRMAQIDRAARVGLAWPDGPFAMMQKVGLERARQLASAVTEFPESGFFTYGEIPARFGEMVSYDVSLASLEVDEETGIGRIKIERPAMLNVLDPQVIADLARRFDEAENDPRVKMIVFEGIGGNLAGADIKFFTDNLKRGVEGLQEIMQFVAAGLNLYSRIEQSKKRTVAVLDGGTFGGGFELALAAHDIIVTPQAKLALPETGLGIIPGLRGADRLAMRVGRGIAFWMMVTGDPRENTVSGADLAKFEVSISLVERGDLEDKLRKFAGGEQGNQSHAG